jgi:hypothetical protein
MFRHIVVAGCVLAVVAGPAYGALMLQAGATNESCKLVAKYDWTVQPPEQATVPPPNPGIWSAKINTTAPNPQEPSLVNVAAVITHTSDSPPCLPPPTPNDTPINLNLTNVVPGPGHFQSLTTAAQVAHGPAVDLGILRTRVTVDKNSAVTAATIEIMALHQGPGAPIVQPSFSNDQKTPETLTITPDYRLNDPTKSIVKGTPVQATIPAGSVLKPDNNLLSPRSGRATSTARSPATR